MRYAIAALLISITAAQAARPFVVRHVEDGHDSYAFAREQSNYVKGNGVLFIGEAVPRAYVDVQQEQVDDITGETTLVTVAVPVAHDQCKWVAGSGAPVARTEAENAAYAAMVASAAQAAQVAALQAIVDNARAKHMILDLEAVVTDLGLARPVSFMEAIVDLNAAIAVNENASNWKNASKGNRQSTTLLALYLALGKAGLDEATINAVYSYMVATGQDQQ